MSEPRPSTEDTAAPTVHQPGERGDAAASPASFVRPVIAFRVDRRALWRWALGALVFAVVYGSGLLVLRRYDLEGVAAGVADRAGLWGVGLYLCLMAAAVMSPLPDAPVALAGLVAYGPVAGLGLVVAGSWLGAMADFLLVRLLGQEVLRRRFPRLVAPVDDLADRLGFELVVVLRFLPTVSFDVVSYAAAITRIPVSHFASATFLGQLPGPTIAALVGAGMGGADPRLTVALSAFAFGLLLVLLYVRRTLRRHREGG